MANQPFVPVAGALRARFAGTCQGAPWVNGFAIQYTGPRPTTSELQAYVTSLRQAWASAFAPAMATHTILTLTQVWDISDTTGANAQDDTDVPGTVVVSAPLPTSSAICLSWPVQSRWRGGHFRTYLPARNYTDLANGRLLNQTARDAVSAAGAAFRTAVNGLTLTGSPTTLIGIRYFPTGTNPDGTPVTRTSGQKYPFGVPNVRTRLDTQRRRLGKEIV